MKKTRLPLVLVSGWALFLLFLLAGCTDTSREGSADSITITDMAGRTVTIEGPIDRIITSQWTSAEILFSVLGEEVVNKLVAVGNNKNSDIQKALYAERYPKLASMPNIGGPRGSFNVEAMIALKPDIFIVNTSDPGSLAHTVNLLEKAGTTTVMISTSKDPIQGPQKSIEIVGKIFGAEDRAQKIIEFITTQFDLIKNKKLSEKTNKPTVYLETGSGTTDQYATTFSTGQWADILELAGADNIAMGAVSENSQIDPEYMINRDPDFIIIVGSPAFSVDLGELKSTFEAYLKRIGWDSLKAVKGNDIYSLDHTQSRNELSFYPALVLAKLFHPEEFEDVNPNEILQEFFKQYMLLDYDQGIWFSQINNI